MILAVRFRSWRNVAQLIAEAEVAFNDALEILVLVSAEKGDAACALGQFFKRRQLGSLDLDDHVFEGAHPPIPAAQLERRAGIVVGGDVAQNVTQEIVGIQGIEADVVRIGEGGQILQDFLTGAERPFLKVLKGSWILAASTWDWIMVASSIVLPPRPFMSPIKETEGSPPLTKRSDFFPG
jgi:hypothetical protein